MKTTKKKGIAEKGIFWTLQSAKKSLLLDIEGTLTALLRNQIGEKDFPLILKQRKESLDRIIRLAKL